MLASRNRQSERPPALRWLPTAVPAIAAAIIALSALAPAAQALDKLRWKVPVAFGTNLPAPFTSRSSWTRPAAAKSR